MSLFIDSEAGLAISYVCKIKWFALALVLNSENNIIIAKLTIWVWCSYDEQTYCLRVVNKLFTW